MLYGAKDSEALPLALLPWSGPRGYPSGHIRYIALLLMEIFRTASKKRKERK